MACQAEDLLANFIKLMSKIFDWIVIKIMRNSGAGYSVHLHGFIENNMAEMQWRHAITLYLLLKPDCQHIGLGRYFMTTFWFSGEIAGKWIFNVMIKIIRELQHFYELWSSLDKHKSFVERAKMDICRTCRWHQTCWSITLSPMHRTRNGSATQRTWPPTRDGLVWRSSSTCLLAW